MSNLKKSASRKTIAWLLVLATVFTNIPVYGNEASEQIHSQITSSVIEDHPYENEIHSNDEVIETEAVERNDVFDDVVETPVERNIIDNLNVEINNDVQHLIINQVYGGGGKSDTPIQQGFIEIYNPTTESIDLSTYSVTYLSSRPTGLGSTVPIGGGVPETKVLALEGNLNANSSYLIVCASETTDMATYLLPTADKTWNDRYIDNQTYTVSLLDASNNTIDTVSAIDKNGIDETVVGISKQKSIRRINYQDTDKKEDFEIVVWNVAPIDENFINTYAPRNMSGDKGVIFNESDVVKPPSFTPNSGAIEFEQLVNISSVTTGSAIYLNIYKGDSATGEKIVDNQLYTNALKPFADNNLSNWNTGDKLTIEAWTKKDSEESQKIAATYTLKEKFVPVSKNDKIKLIGNYSTGVSDGDGGIAEIVKFNKDNKKIYVVNGALMSVDIVDVSNLSHAEFTESNLDNRIDMSTMATQNGFACADITSVDINTKDDVIALAVQGATYNDKGSIVICDYEGNYIKHFEAGYQPDMVKFTPDFKYVLTANEGEPREGYTAPGAEDPEGTVTIVDLSNDSVRTASFHQFDDATKRAELVQKKVLLKKGANPSQDLEPEYIAIDENSEYAYVSLQEANSIAVLNIEVGEFESIYGLGFKDHSVSENALDSKKDSQISIQTEDLYGVYMPDGLSTINIKGKQYVLTPNEGDAREWGTSPYKYSNIQDYIFPETRYKMDSIINSEHDGLDDSKTYILGGRSFSIWDAEDMSLVYDSGKDFEEITSGIYPTAFNSNHSKVELDGRSAKKGPEPEDVQTVKIGNKVYAIVGLERMGGIMIYDITDPTNPVFYDYINARDITGTAVYNSGALGPEGIYTVEAKDSPTGYPLIFVANEVSGSVSIMEFSDKGNPVDGREDGKFKIVFMPDTQVYSSHYPEIFNSQTNWIADNFEADDIEFVLHLGDIVDWGEQMQWDNANAAMDILDNANVPYGVTIGNHDVSNNKEDFIRYFGKSRAEDKPGYIGHSENQLNSAYTFSAEGYEFLVLFLNLDATNDDLAWAQSIIDANNNKPTIIATHTLIGTSGTLATKPYLYKTSVNNSPLQIWEKLISNNDQIFMTINGHDHGAYDIIRSNNSGLEVMQYLTDYQGGTKGGNGFLRVVEFDMNNDQIMHTTYSPYLQSEKTEGKNKFTQKIDLERRFNNEAKLYQDNEIIGSIIAGYSSFEERWGVREATKLVDGSGITGYKDQIEVSIESQHKSGSYESAAEAMWNSEYLGVKSTNKFEGNKTHVVPVADRGEWVAFDLGSKVDISHLILWQYGMGGDYADMGAKDIDVYVSSDSVFTTAQFNYVNTITLDEHIDGEALLSQVKEIPKQEDVRYVKLVFKSNYGDERSVGLSEVRFVSSESALESPARRVEELIVSPKAPDDYKTIDDSYFSVEKTDSATPDGWAYYIGQSFTPKEQGITGVGEIPEGTEFARLDTFEVFIYTPDNIPNKIYLYDMSQVPADSDTLKSDNYSFTTNSQEAFNFPVSKIGEGTYNAELSKDYFYTKNGIEKTGKRAVYTFDNQLLDVNKEVMLVLERPTGLRYWQSTEYEGGYAIWTNGNMTDGNYRLFPFKTDIDFVATLTPVKETQNNDDNFDFTLLHINDHHSHLDSQTYDLPLNYDNDQSNEKVRLQMGGMSYIDSLTKANKNDHSLFLQSGELNGTLYYSMFGQGEADFDVLNVLSPDAYMVGNHEFDEGDDNLVSLIDKANFPILSGNMVPNSASPLFGKFNKPYIIKEVDGEKVAIIGVVKIEKTKHSSMISDNVDFIDEIEFVNETVSGIKAQGINKIILLSHLGYDFDIEVAKVTKDIDIIVGGDTHNLLDSTGQMSEMQLPVSGEYPTTVNNADNKNVYIVQAWEYANALGKLEVKFNSVGEIIEAKGNTIVPVGGPYLVSSGDNWVEAQGETLTAIKNSIANYDVLVEGVCSAEVDAIVDPIKAEIERSMTQKMGTVEKTLPFDRIPYLFERGGTANGSFAGQVVADAFLNYAKVADIAIQNAGGVRAPLMQGDFTMADALTILPFSNTVALIRVKGSDIVDVLDEAIRYSQGVSQSTGAFPYASHLRYDVYLNAPNDVKSAFNVEVKDRTTGTWSPIDMNKEYTIVTNSFTVLGKDNYLAFSRAIEKDPSVMVNLAVQYSVPLIDYVQNLERLGKEVTFNKDNYCLKSVANYTVPTFYSVKFDSNGGSAIEPIRQNKDTQIKTAPITTRTNYTFDGWCSDSSLTNKIAFPYTITEDVTFYAKWIYNGSSSGGSSSGGGSSSISSTTPTNKTFDELVVGQIKSDKVPTIQLSTNVNTATLTEKTLKSVVDSKKDLTISNSILSMILSSSFIESLKLTTNDKIEIIIKADIPKVLDSINKMDLVNEELIKKSFDVSIKKNGKVISNFNQPIRMTIDISSMKFTDAQKKKLTGVKFLDDGKVKQLGGKVDANKFTFVTQSLSKYGVIVSDTLIKITTTIGNTSYSVNDLRKTTDVAPAIIDGKTMVPVRFIAEALGADVTWMQETQTVSIKLNEQNLSFKVGQKSTGMDVAPIILNGRTLVPLRYISEQLGANVVWNEDTKSIDIYK